MVPMWEFCKLICLILQRLCVAIRLGFCKDSDGDSARILVVPNERILQVSCSISARFLEEFVQTAVGFLSFRFM